MYAFQLCFGPHNVSSRRVTIATHNPNIDHLAEFGLRSRVRICVCVLYPQCTAGHLPMTFQHPKYPVAQRGAHDGGYTIQKSPIWHSTG